MELLKVTEQHQRRICSRFKDLDQNHNCTDTNANICQFCQEHSGSLQKGEDLPDTQKQKQLRVHQCSLCVFKGEARQ